MKPFTQMTDAELIYTADMMVKRLRERLVQVPSDFAHHSEMFEAEAEDFRDLAAYIAEHAIDICCDRNYFGKRQPQVDDYNADRSIDPMELRNGHESDH